MADPVDHRTSLRIEYAILGLWHHQTYGNFDLTVFFAQPSAGRCPRSPTCEPTARSSRSPSMTGPTPG
jgi:hypothetical protein